MSSIIFCGTSSFAVPALKALASDNNFQVTAVITQPDRPTGRKMILTASPIKEEAKSLGLRIEQPESLNTALPSLSLKRPDFLVVVAYGQIFSADVLAFPLRIPVNVHGSLLPRWRGASPIHQAILTGDHETGVTVQQMVKQLDAGAILNQVSTPIDPRETFLTLHDRLAQLGAGLLVQTLKNPLHPLEQDESEITFCHKLTREDGRADPATMSAEEIDRRVRALTPWPGVTLDYEGLTLKILETSLTPEAGALGIPCNRNSTLYVLKLQEPGKKAMTAGEWMRGR